MPREKDVDAWQLGAPSGVLCEDPGMTIKKVYVLIAIMQKSPT
jgi:hypothetical protein